MTTLYLYIAWALMVGLLYGYYYLATNETSILKKLPTSQKIVAYGVVFGLPTLFAPITVFLLIKIIIKDGGIKK